MRKKDKFHYISYFSAALIQHLFVEYIYKGQKKKYNNAQVEKKE